MIQNTLIIGMGALGLLYADIIDDPVHLLRFEEIYESHRKQMMRTANAILMDEHEAEDAVQELFVKLYRSPPDSSIAKPRAYLFRAARNMALDMLFVAVLGFGVGAAAIATTISQGISAALCCIHLLRVDAPYQITLKEIRFDKKSLLNKSPCPM